MRLHDEVAARKLVTRSILSKGIYELWGSGSNYEELHENVRQRTSSHWAQYKSSSFKIDFDTFQGKRTMNERREIIDSFRYLGFTGLIKMQEPEEVFCIFEHSEWGVKRPHRIRFGRWVADSQRDAAYDYSLKTRKYLSTTSMDSELALLSANITLAAPGKLFYDPFVGTGSFPIACSHFGAISMGSDIDGRMLRGKDGLNIVTNFQQYGLTDRYLDGFVSDLTHCPLRTERFLDGIICDPPYGVREGLKVLGTRDGSGKGAVYIDGEAAHL